MITKEKLETIVPKETRRYITDSFVEKLNTIVEGEDENFTEAFRENFIGYTSVLKGGDYKLSDYMNAVKYVSYKLMEMQNIDAYRLTFPERYEALLEKYQDFGSEEDIRSEKISPYVSAYNKNKLVNQIMEQTLVPNHILNAPLYQKALNEQARLMMHANSEMVRTKAADSLLTHLRPPEVAKYEINMGIKENDAISELRRVTQEMVAMQRLGIQSGAVTSKQIAESTIIQAEIIDE